MESFGVKVFAVVLAMDEDEMGRCLEVVRRYVPNAELRGV